MNKIIFVSHCVLNTSSKVFSFEKVHEPEGEYRRAFLFDAISNSIQLVQLPCPEFIMYGSKRWGHSREQFDNEFFKSVSRELLSPFIKQLVEYTKDERSTVLGIVGINGSPSCGVDFSFSADWYGELGSNTSLDSMLKNYSYDKRYGVYMEVLDSMMRENNLNIPIYPLRENLIGDLLSGGTYED